MPILFLCEHAGNSIPTKLNDLGLPPEDRNRHISYDLGARELTGKITHRFSCDAMFANYSRLVVDCNRSTDSTELMAKESDGTIVPGNVSLCKKGRQSRLDEIYTPFHNAIQEKIAELDNTFKQKVMVVSVHSFTPKMKVDPLPRPWQIGILWKDDKETAQAMFKHLKKAEGLVVGDNQPYSMTDAHSLSYPPPFSGYVEDGRPHLLLEIRTDQISTAFGQNRFAQLFTDFFKEQIRPSPRRRASYFTRLDA